MVTSATSYAALMRRRKAELADEIIALRKRNQNLQDYLARSSTSSSSGVSALMQAEEELLKSEEQFRHVFETSAAGMALLTMDGQYFKVNQRFCEIVGYDEQELLTMTWRDLTVQEEIAKIEALDQQVEAGERADFKTERRLVCKDGRIIWTSLASAQLRDKNGVPHQIFSFVQDISERKRTEAALVQSEEWLSKMVRAVEQTSELIALFDPEDRILYTNKAWRDLNAVVERATKPGTTFEEHIRALVDDGFVPEAIGREEEWVSERLQSHRNPSGPFEMSRQDNRWILVNEKVLEDGSTIQVTSDITEMKSKEAELQKSEKAARVSASIAEAANSAKSDFLATMSHELRTPLTSSIGSLGLLDAMMSDDLSDEGRELVKIAVRNNKSLLRLVNELLDYEKILSGTLEIETDRHDICKLTSQAVNDNLGYARMQSVNFILSDHPTPLFANVQEYRFEQVLGNLLSNAAKFSDPGSDVEICTETDGTNIRVKVKDYGPGIPPSFRESIFKKFTQMDSSTTRKHGGTGLGLPISKALTESMGGILGLETEVGVGSTFFITLPALE